MKRTKKFFADFKKFITRGNIVDMSVAVIVGAAFSSIVTALTNKIIMPFVNWILALTGGDKGLESAYTFLKTVYAEDGVTVDLTKSIYIDWGAFVAAVLNFLIIAFTVFSIVRLIMSTQGYLTKAIHDQPTKAERKILKERGVNMKNNKEVVKATAELRKENAPAPVEPKPTQEELLAQILVELKKQNTEESSVKEEDKKDEKKPAKTSK